MTPHPLGVGCTPRLPSTGHSAKRGKSNFTVETLERCHFRQVSKVNVTVKSHPRGMFCGLGVTRRALHLCGLPQSCNPNPPQANHVKTPDKSRLRDFPQYT